MSPFVVVAVSLIFLAIGLRRHLGTPPHGIESVRGWFLLFLTFTNFLIAYLVVDSIVPGFLDQRSFWPHNAFDVLAYAGCALTALWYVRNRKIKNVEILGSSPQWAVARRHILLAIPLIVLSVGSVWLLYFPLSYFFPEVTHRWLSSGPSLVIFQNGTFLGVANLSSLALVVLLVPMVEEYVFRGILLRCWTERWGAPSAVWFSSAIFAIAHVDILGAFVFGFVTAVTYIRSGSLLIPIIIHAANNGLAWLLELGESIIRGPEHTYTLSEFQSEWWIGALALAVALPWSYRFVSRNLPSKSWHFPANPNPT